MEIFSKACDRDSQVAKNKRLTKELEDCKDLLREATSILRAYKYDNKDFYERIKKFTKPKKGKKTT
jgi:hypothetical protein